MDIVQINQKSQKGREHLDFNQVAPHGPIQSYPNHMGASTGGGARDLYEEDMGNMVISRLFDSLKGYFCHFKPY